MNIEGDRGINREVVNVSELEKYFNEGGDEKWCGLLVNRSEEEVLKQRVGVREEMKEIGTILLKSGMKTEEVEELGHEGAYKEAKRLYFDHLLGEKGRKKSEMIRMAVDDRFPREILNSQVTDLMEILIGVIPEEMSEKGKEDFQEYVWRNLSGSGKEEDLLYESYDTDEEWIDLARREFREREERMTQYGQREFDTVGLEAKSGVEVPMFKHMEGREELAESLKEEGRARLGIHNAFIAWKSSCSRPESLLRAFGFFIKDQELPKSTAEGISLMWLKSLSEAEGELGEEIGKALALYIEEGEKSGDAYNDMKRRKRADIKAKMDDKSENIFSQIYQPAKIVDVRERIARETSVDGEEIAYRLVYLFGLAAKYSYSQSGGCAEKDGLGTLFRVNDFWQDTINKKGILPAPEPIVGSRDDVSRQPFNRLTFLQSYPEMVGEILLKSGKSKNLVEVLRDGDFSQVKWEEVDFDHGGFLARIDKALKLRDKLSALTHKPEEVSKDAILGLKDMIEKALEHEREIVNVEKKKKETVVDGVKWEKSEFDRVRGEKDSVTQGTLYFWAKGVIEGHSPLNSFVQLDDCWGLESLDAFLGNLSEVLSDEKMGRLNKKIKKLSWAWSLASRQAERF